MIYLDLALRGGAVTLLLMLAVLLWRAPIGREGRLSVTALALSNSAFLVTTTAMPLDFNPILFANLMLLSSLTPAAITWLIVTIFLDAPERRWPWFIGSLIASASLYAHLATQGGFPYCLPIAVALYGALFVLSIWSTRDDLVECRCRARPGFAAAIAGLGLFLTIGQMTGVLQQGTVALALAQAAGTLAVAFVFAAWLLNPDADRWPGATPLDTIVAAPPTPQFADPNLIARIQTAMASQIWREEGLTIGTLAVKLGVPEHRLRRAINQGLGYRNFSRFINRARIEAACVALNDPAQLNVTVLEVAYDVGFSSMGPFNRAFRAEVGHSPTEYRRLVATNTFADSEKSASIGAKLH